jgi:hypothetical protein
VLEHLKPDRPVRQQWVYKVLADCFQASARLNPEQRRIGRRFLVSWRAHNR